MKISRRHLLLSLPSAWAAGDLQAQTNEQKVISAGPFKLRCPEAWAAGVVTEKVAAKPVYSPEAWQALQANPLLSLKPSYGNRPEHWAIRFPQLRLPGSDLPLFEFGQNETAPQILIHRTAGWAAIERGEADEATRKRKTAELRAQMDKLLRGEPDFRTPAFIDGGLSFPCLKQPLAFKTGHGMRMIAQWTIEATLLNKESLHYLFAGMSADDSCYIIATFPISLDGVPSGLDSDAAHLGFSLKNYQELSDRFPEYQKKATDWLESQAANIRPKLDEIDAMIESLKAETWK